VDEDFSTNLIVPTINPYIPENLELISLCDGDPNQEPDLAAQL
jgi:hypothetical protein